LRADLHIFAQNSAHFCLSQLVSGLSISGFEWQNPLYPRSASASSLPRLGLCFSLRWRFLFSARFTGGGVPSTARDAAFTALVALNAFGFLFGTAPFKHKAVGN
jgi:hypothetical protein